MKSKKFTRRGERRMERTSEFTTLANQSMGSRLPSSPSRKSSQANRFVKQANEVFCQLCAYQSLLELSHDAYVGYHRYICHIAPEGHRKSLYFRDSDRTQLRDETVHFMSGVATLVQELSNTMDENGGVLNSSRARHCQLVLSDLIHKLTAVSKTWENMQQERVRVDVSPTRLHASLYQQHQAEQPPSQPSAEQSKASAATGSATVKGESASFAQRFHDEIAPPAKMQVYESIAKKQRAALFKETQALSAQFSEDLAESLKLERNVLSVSHLVTEFATLLEGQSDLVEDIGEVARDVKESVSAADQQLLVTLERSQSQNWNTVVLVLALSAILLFVHFFTP